MKQTGGTRIQGRCADPSLFLDTLSPFTFSNVFASHALSCVTAVKPSRSSFSNQPVLSVNRLYEPERQKNVKKDSSKELVIRGQSVTGPPKLCQSNPGENKHAEPGAARRPSVPYDTEQSRCGGLRSHRF
jgi:hypothetical protein